jgi:hypothetical protein
MPQPRDAVVDDEEVGDRDGVLHRDEDPQEGRHVVAVAEHPRGRRDVRDRAPEADHRLVGDPAVRV